MMGTLQPSGTIGTQKLTEPSRICMTWKGPSLSKPEVTSARHFESPVRSSLVLGVPPESGCVTSPPPPAAPAVPEPVVLPLMPAVPPVVGDPLDAGAPPAAPAAPPTAAVLPPVAGVEPPGFDAPGVP